MAYVNPSISCKTELILGIGNGVLIIRLFNSLKSERNRTGWFDLGIINVGDPHSDSGCLFSTPSSTNLLTSFLNTLSCECGIGYGRPW